MLAPNLHLHRSSADSSASIPTTAPRSPHGGSRRSSSGRCPIAPLYPSTPRFATRRKILTRRGYLPPLKGYGGSWPRRVVGSRSPVKKSRLGRPRRCNHKLRCDPVKLPNQITASNCRCRQGSMVAAAPSPLCSRCRACLRGPGGSQAWFMSPQGFVVADGLRGVQPPSKRAKVGDGGVRFAGDLGEQLGKDGADALGPRGSVTG